jgi:2-polyprenyl-6-methoxyphenol hydroxylase-like FAD-dependent oxidoreductase
LKSQQPAKPDDYEVIIVGAGPVGLLLANLLGQYRIKTLVIEQEIKRKEGLRAIGITPPSLQILSSLNLSYEFISRGMKNHQVFIHGSFFAIWLWRYGVGCQVSSYSGNGLHPASGNISHGRVSHR